MTADNHVKREGISVQAPTETTQPTQNASHTAPESGEERAPKRLKVADSVPDTVNTSDQGNAFDSVAKETEGSSTKIADGVAESAPANEPRRGVAPIKKEYLIAVPRAEQRDTIDDDAAEGRSEQVQNGDARDARDERGEKGKKDKRDKKKNKGQNVERSFGRFDDAIRLCNSRANFPEFSPGECRFGDNCQLSHDLRKYLAEGRRGDLETFDGKCPSFEAYGKCTAGFKCRFVKSHMREVEHKDGRKELVLIDSTAKESQDQSDTNGEDKSNDHDDTNEAGDADEGRAGVYNIVSGKVKYELSRKRVDFTKTEQYISWCNGEAKINDSFNQRRKAQATQGIEDLRAQFVDPPFKASEKRRLYFGPETPALAPLTTQGNLPFRRLCVELGAELTYSEMAVGMPLVQGAKADWTLLKAHQTEIMPPKFSPVSGIEGRKKNMVFDDYNHARDLRFGAQISASAPWVATKAADVLNRYCPHLRLIDLNCGCPIDMIFKSGGGSALLESGGKLERMIRGMNVVSGEVPITAKIRTGVKNNRPTAQQIIGRLAFGGREHRERLGAPGCAAVTLHGRSREQRYTKKADWGFIADCATLIQSYNDQKDALTDTAAEPDPSTLPNTKDGKMYFLGNGDCYSHIDYQEHIEKARVDSVMIGRGALIKPWLFEEIEKGQYLDKSASERLTYIEKFVRYGLEAWGSDELGIGYTRRFLLEWLSFTHRYVPIGLLEHLPPNLNDRPPAYKGRNDLETLMASDNYLDWIKISEMFLGPVHPTFKFQPKHKSNAYEAEG